MQASYDLCAAQCNGLQRLPASTCQIKRDNKRTLQGIVHTSAENTAKGPIAKTPAPGDLGSVQVECHLGQPEMLWPKRKWQVMFPCSQDVRTAVLSTFTKLATGLFDCEF